jgi:hypothetical protein
MTQEEVPDEAKAPDKHLVRKSMIWEHVNLMNVLNQVLSAKVELAIGKIIGVSCELSGQLSNTIKFKSASRTYNYRQYIQDQVVWPVNQDNYGV